jgi:MFS family permease
MASMPTYAQPPALRGGFALLATVQLVLGTTVAPTSISGPAIRAACALSEGQLVTVSTAYPLAFSGLLLPGGRLTDLAGQRRSFTGGVLLYAVGCVLAVRQRTSHSWWPRAWCRAPVPHAPCPPP